MRRRMRRRALVLMSKIRDLDLGGIDLDVSMEQIIEDLESAGVPLAQNDGLVGAFEQRSRRVA